MIREEGVSSLGRGVVPNVFRAVLMNASQLASWVVVSHFFVFLLCFCCRGVFILFFWGVSVMPSYRSCSCSCGFSPWSGPFKWINDIRESWLESLLSFFCFFRFVSISVCLGICSVRFWAWRLGFGLGGFLPMSFFCLSDWLNSWNSSKKINGYENS